jgi:hypothetical protein
MVFTQIAHVRNLLPPFPQGKPALDHPSGFVDQKRQSDGGRARVHNRTPGISRAQAVALA